MTDRVYLEPADIDRLGELVLELAQQLHVERARRIALEEALLARGVLAPGEVETIARAGNARAHSQLRLDESLERLLRIMAASGGPAAPLR